MKKISALLLALVLCLVLAAPAFAENPTDNSGSGILDAVELDRMVEEYAGGRGVSGDRFSVGLIYTATGESYYYNGDAWYYSASLYKVPTCMLLSEKVAAGELTQGSNLTSSYGGGTVEYLESSAIVWSNNNSGHAIVEYLGGTYSGKCTDQLKKYAPMDDSYYSNRDFYDYSYYSARFMNEVLFTLFRSPDSYPRVLDFMKEAIPGQYLKLNESRFEIAQKYGALTDNSGVSWNHAAGIIFTEHPIIVSVMTKNVGDYESFIGGMSKLLTDYALTLDTVLPGYLAGNNPEDGQNAAASPAVTEEGITVSLADDTAKPAAPAAKKPVPNDTDLPMIGPFKIPLVIPEEPTAADIIGNANPKVLVGIAIAAGVASVGVIIGAVVLNTVGKDPIMTAKRTERRF